MSCPYLQKQKARITCQTGESFPNHPQRFLLWICEHEWERYCPYYYERQNRRLLLPPHEDGQGNEPSAYHIRHVNRNGGPRTFEAELR